MERKPTFTIIGILLAALLLGLAAQRGGLLASVGDGLDALQEVDVPKGDVRVKIVEILNFLLSFVALAAVVVIIVAGFMFLFSFGSENTIQRAKKVIIYAVIGLLVIFFAIVIVSFFTRELPAIFGS